MTFEQWWSQQPPDRVFVPRDQHECPVGCWLKEKGYSYVFVSKLTIRTEKGIVNMNPVLKRVVRAVDEFGVVATKADMDEAVREAISE